MVHSVKCLSYEHGYLNLVFSSHIKCQAWKHTLIIPVGQREKGDLRILLPTSLAKLVSPRFLKRHCLAGCGEMHTFNSHTWEAKAAGSP